jgi:HEAT repeat protein
MALRGRVEARGKLRRAMSERSAATPVPAASSASAAPPPPGPGGERPAPEPGDSALRQVLGLFVVPLLVVLVCVAVFVGFGWIAYERQGVGDLLNDLRSGWPSRRWQAAYELSKVLTADPQAIRNEPGAAAELRRLFAAGDDDPRVRRYLALVLGRVGDHEAVPLLVAALDDPDAETRVYALWSLGALGDERARGPLLRALADADPGIRKTAAFALRGYGGAEVRDALAARLDDGVADVRWNAALALAARGDAAAAPVLAQMVDRSALAQVPGITPQQQEEAMIAAVPALARVGGAAARPRLERLAAGDPSLRVRQAALRALGR